jgi:putative transposase
LLLTVNNKIKSKNKVKLQILKELTKNSKDLYNKTLYTIRQYFFENNKYLPYKEAYKILKETEEYRKLPTNASQQTMKQVDNSFKSFFNLLKSKKSGKYNNPVKIPKYLDKEGHYKVVYTKIHFKILEYPVILL